MLKKNIYFFIIILTLSGNLFAQSKIDTLTLTANKLGYPKKIWIYLPVNYAKDIHKKFPVLYMMDGQNLFDSKSSFAGEWQVDETLDSLKANCIVVGIEHGNQERINELTPFKNDNYGGGKADLMLDFILHQVMPNINSTYRTKTDKNHTAIFGSSLGGLFAYYAVFKHPDIFGKAGVFSPAFWINKKELLELSKATDKSNAKFYFMCGTKESENMVTDLNELAHDLNRIRCECKMLTKKVIIINGEHNEKLWREQFAKAYLWLF